MKKILLSAIIFLVSANLYASYYSQGKGAYTYKKYDKAIGLFQKAIAANPKHGDAYYFLGETYKIIKKYDLAIDNYRLAVENNVQKKYRQLAYWNLIVLHEQKNDVLGMVKSCKIFWDKTKDPAGRKKVNELTNKMLWTSNEKAKALYAKGQRLERKGQKEEALKSYKAALTEDPKFLAAKYEIGMYHYNSGNTNQAAQYFTIITEKIPFYTAPNLLMAQIYFVNQSYSNAAKLYTNVLEYGFIGNSTKYKTHLNRGKCYFKMRDYDLAIADIEECRKLKSSATEPLQLLSYIYIEKKNYEDALIILNRLNKVRPNNPETLYKLGSLYYLQQNKQYIIYFDRLFDVENRKNEEFNSRYIKAFKLLASHHYERKSFTRCSNILSAFPESRLDRNSKLILAKCYYNTNSYQKCIETLEQLSLDSEYNFMLVNAYLKSNNREKAKITLRNITKYSESNKKEALNKPLLKNLMLEIIKEDKNINEETDEEKDNGNNEDEKPMTIEEKANEDIQDNSMEESENNVLSE